MPLLAFGCLWAAALPAADPSAAAPATMQPLADYLGVLARITTLRCEQPVQYAVTVTGRQLRGPLRIVVKGDAFLAAQWADIPDKKPILRSLFASNSDSWQAYEGWTGTITTLRRSPKLPFGPNPIPVPISRCPLVLEPIECLGYEDGEASSFLALDWVQLRRPGFLEQRMAALHATVSTAADGGWDVVVPTNDFLEQAGSEPKVVHFGRTETYHVRPYPEHGGLRLVERITYARKGEPPAGSRTFTYRAFPGVPGEPLLVLAVSKAGSGDQPEQLTSISVGAPVASDEVQIDPTMAKRILDLETGMTIQP